MPELKVRLPARRVGNSIGFIIPSRAVREEGIRPGMEFEVTLKREPASLLGFAKDIYDGPYVRRKEDAWRDRL